MSQNIIDDTIHKEVINGNYSLPIKMATLKDTDKVRDFRRLRKENIREREESDRKSAELKAMEAQKEHYMRMLQLKEQHLRQVQEELLKSHRDSPLSGRICRRK